jgi:hypothetical protein
VASDTQIELARAAAKAAFANALTANHDDFEAATKAAWNAGIDAAIVAGFEDEAAHRTPDQA